MGLSLAWVLLAPVYSAALAGVAGLAAPLLESDVATRYETEGAKIVAVRSLVANGQRATVRLGLWNGRFAWNLTLLLAALLAVPEWAGWARGRAVLWAVGGMAIVHGANILLNVVYTQMRGVPGQEPVQFSAVTEAVVSTMSYFFDVAGNGFFAILLFVMLVSRLWRPAAVGRTVGRNEACPCGSGRKAKHCCQSG